MPAFVKVNFTKPLTIKKGNNNDLATRFQISNTSSAPPNPSLVILSAQIQGNSVLLELQNDEMCQAFRKDRLWRPEKLDR